VTGRGLGFPVGAGLDRGAFHVDERSENRGDRNGEDVNRFGEVFG